jgi:hypothetical protein
MNMRMCREIYERENHFITFDEMKKAHDKICKQFEYIVDNCYDKSDELVDVILAKLSKDMKKFENDFNVKYKYDFKSMFILNQNFKLDRGYRYVR